MMINPATPCLSSHSDAHCGYSSSGFSTIAASNATAAIGTRFFGLTSADGVGSPKDYRDVGGDARQRSSSTSLQHMKFQRPLLAAHLERPEPSLRDAGRERGEAVEQGRGREHAIVGLAARLLDPCGCVHRVADQRDLLLKVALPARLPPDRVMQNLGSRSTGRGATAFGAG